MKRIVAAIMATLLLGAPALAAAPVAPEVPAPSVVLMEKESGKILYTKNGDQPLPPASVTKVMTILLIMEALDTGMIRMDEQVQVSEHAASMGGSQIWLEPGETMSVEDMLKCIVVVSANDASVAMGEHIAGSEEGFVARMNERAAELGMKNTHFENCTGLDAEGHLTTAHDIALMAREVMKNHPEIRQYTTIWMDTVRGGEFGLSNTNKLIRFYNGATGLKTGSTSVARFCLAGSAERDGMELIVGIMAADSSEGRFSTAKMLFDYGFANYALKEISPDATLTPVQVVLGERSQIVPQLGEGDKVLLEKSAGGELTQTVELAENVQAPVQKGQKLGEMKIMSGERLITTIPLVAGEDIERLDYGDVCSRFFSMLFMGGEGDGEPAAAE